MKHFVLLENYIIYMVGEPNSQLAYTTLILKDLVMKSFL